MGVDLSIFMNKLLFTDIDKLASTSNPAYPAPDLLQNIKNIHTNLSRYMTLVYVFDGIELSYLLIQDIRSKNRRSLHAA